MFMTNSTSLLALCMLLNSTASFEQAGSLDSTFGGNGKVTTTFGTYGVGNSVAIQADGKIVVAGSYYNGLNNDFALVRYKSDGKLDSAFGDKFKVSTDFGGNDVGYSVAIQADKKIVVAGSSSKNYGDFALARFRQNGKPDSSFGINGKVTSDFGGGGGGYAVAIQADGKILVAGSSYNEFALARYNADGKRDTTFGARGRVITGFLEYSKANSVAIQADGKIVVAGSTTDGDEYDYVLARYNANGELDHGFGYHGVVVDGGYYSFGFVGKSVAIQPDGRIVMACEYSYALERFQPNGRHDSTFGVNGIARSDAMDGVGSVTIQTDGKILVAGYSLLNGTGDFALVRYKQNGKVDSTFGTNGNVITDGKNTYDFGNSVAIQADGKMVVAGYASNGLNAAFAVARYNGDNTSAVNSRKDNFSNRQKQNNASTNIYLSPNPVKDILHIEGLSSSSRTISILDAKGKLLQQTTTANRSYSFNVKQLSTGMYFIRIDEGGKTNTLKFIKE